MGKEIIKHLYSDGHLTHTTPLNPDNLLKVSPTFIFADEDTEVQVIYATELMSSREINMDLGLSESKAPVICTIPEYLKQ